MIVQSSSINWEEEKVQNWNRKNHSLPPSVARVYEDTRIGHQIQVEPQPTIAKTLFMRCIPDCKSCDGYVNSDSGSRYKCGCIHHILVEAKRNTI